MDVQPATLSPAPAADGSAAFVPQSGDLSVLDDFGYAQQEYFATGVAEGHPYTTMVYARWPKDYARASRTVVVEPVHGSSYVPIWAYTNEYILRSGHTWIGICSLKSVLDTHIKPSNPERYASTEIWSDAPAPDVTPTQDPAVMQSRMEQRRLLDVLSNPILAQIGAALAATYPEDDVPSFLLCGHSHTGGVVINYIRGGHDVYRQDDRSPVYHGFLPTGSAGVSPGESSSVTLGPCDVPILQVLSEGDISNPNRFGADGRAYRRPDSDDRADRYRLYEIAGIGHIDTRYPPGNDVSFWRAASGFGANAGDVPEDAHMNSLPHHRLFSMALDQLAKWVGDGTTPPRADRIDVGPDGLFVKDECGNSRGGVRCVQLDVPKATYFANPGVGDDGLPARGVVGIEKPLSKEKLASLYRDHADYVERFDRRLDELVDQGWLLPEDADEMRAEAEKADVP